jgi:hypothetical protein
MLKQGFSNTSQARAPRAVTSRALRTDRLSVCTHAPPEATRHPRHAFPMHCTPRLLGVLPGPHASRRAVPAGAHRGPSVCRWRPAVRAPVEVAVLLRNIHCHCNITGEVFPYKSRTFCPFSRRHRRPPRHPRRRRRAVPPLLPTAEQPSVPLP